MQTTDRLPPPFGSWNVFAEPNALANLGGAHGEISEYSGIGSESNAPIESKACLDRN